MPDRFITSVIVEENNVQNFEASVGSAGAIDVTNVQSSWDPSASIDQNDPSVFFDQLARQLESHWASHAVVNCRGTTKITKDIVISLPGTLLDEGKIKSSSRLKIYEEFDVAQYLKRRQINAKLVHDVEAMALGEFLHIENQLDIKIEETTLALVLVDEGVGAKFFINGRSFSGAGVAGTISRLVVQPEGAYFSKLLTRGNLEVYASRPWISRTIVENFNSLSEKIGSTTTENEDQSEDRRHFDRRLNALSENSENWGNLSFEEIGDGVLMDHPCCVKSIRLAEKYIGRAIHSIMTILNPHVILIGGKITTEVPSFYENCIELARDLSWPNCWNSSKIMQAHNVRHSQIVGAVKLGTQ